LVDSWTVGVILDVVELVCHIYHC